MKIFGGLKQKGLESTFQSPVYSIHRVSIEDIAAQKTNPNSMTAKSFAALQVSIMNSGYTFPVLVSQNEDYDPALDTLSIIDKINLIINGSLDDFKSGGKIEFATETSDIAISRYFKYRVVDGQQRSSIIRLGTKYFVEDGVSESLLGKWVKNIDVPTEPGRMLLKYLAWKENFSIPCVILSGLSNVDSMSVTVLMNQAKGAHRFSTIKDIIYDLVNIEGKSENWVAKNMYLDIESVKRISQLAGLKSAFDDAENIDLSWAPENTKIYKNKLDIYIVREARIYLEDYLTMGEIRRIHNIPEEAKKYGWDEKRARESAKKTKMELMPNGSRKHGSIHNGFVPNEKDKI